MVESLAMAEDKTPHVRNMAQEYADQQEAKRLEFEERQEHKRQEFEARLESQKARREWMMLIITCAAVAAAFWTGYEARHARLQAAHDAEVALTTQSEIQQAAVRPLVSADPIVKGRFLLRNPDGTLPLSLRVMSKGQSPAIGVSYKIECGPRIDHWESYVRQNFEKHDAYAVLGTLADKDEKVVQCPVPVHFEPIGDSAGAAVQFSYTDVFSNQYQVTYFFVAVLMNEGAKVGLAGPPEIKITHIPRE